MGHPVIPRSGFTCRLGLEMYVRHTSFEALGYGVLNESMLGITNFCNGAPMAIGATVNKY